MITNTNKEIKHAFGCMIYFGCRCSERTNFKGGPIMKIFLLLALLTPTANAQDINLALGKPAISSSVSAVEPTSKWAPSKAVDGLITLDDTGRFCSASIAGSTWEVDLGKKYRLNRLEIFSGKYNKYGNLIAADIFADGVKVASFSDGSGFHKSIPLQVDAQKVMIKHLSSSTDSALRLREVQVFGSEIPTPTPSPSEPVVRYVPAKSATATEPAQWGYGVYLPEGYSEKSNWPVLLFMHGMGECTGKVSLETAVSRHGPIKELRARLWKLPMVIIAPQSNCNWSGALTQKFLDYALPNYKVDMKRFYITGLSLGGGGVAKYLDAHPSKPAAAIAVCPATHFSNALTPQALVENGVPVWTAVAKDDGVTSPSHARLMVSSIWQKFGTVPSSYQIDLLYPKVTATARYVPSTAKVEWILGQGADEVIPPCTYTLYPSGGHSIWGRIYGDLNTYTWLLKQSKH